MNRNLDLVAKLESLRRALKGSQGSWYRPGAFPGKKIPGGGVFVRSLKGGKKRLRPKCPPGKIFKQGRCVRVSGTERIKLARAARKRRIKILKKRSMAKIRRARTMRKRAALGLNRKK